MRILWRFLLPVLGTLVASGGMAADFDGSKPFLCATADVSSCVPGENCERESAQTVNAPAFFIVDAANKLVSEPGASGSNRSSAIDHVDHQSGLLMLSGRDGDETWTASIGESTGKLSYAVIGDRMVVVAFGSCLKQQP